MVKILVGDIFESRCQTLVNTVNCVGVMGKGLALEFKKRFPEMYEDYARRCEREEVRLGEPYLFKRLLPPWILNFPTKQHWRSVARLGDIVGGLEFLKAHCAEWGVESIAVPPLGCGEGKLEWRVVGPTLYRHLAELDVHVELYAPATAKDEELQPEFLAAGQEARRSAAESARVDPAWVALVEILREIESEPYHRPIGRVGFQKLVYFATKAGIPTRLEFRRGSYGPFAPELKRMETWMVNNGLIEEERLGRMFAMRVGPSFADARAPFAHEVERWRPEIDRVADLMLRLDTRQSEVAATAHFAAETLAEARGRRPSEQEVLEEALSWKARRKPPLSEAELARAIRGLAMLGWLDVEASKALPVEEQAVVGV